jgi:hypothetical protein
VSAVGAWFPDKREQEQVRPREVGTARPTALDTMIVTFCCRKSRELMWCRHLHGRTSQIRGRFVPPALLGAWLYIPRRVARIGRPMAVRMDYLLSIRQSAEEIWHLVTISARSHHKPSIVGPGPPFPTQLGVHSNGQEPTFAPHPKGTRSRRSRRSRRVVARDRTGAVDKSQPAPFWSTRVP